MTQYLAIVQPFRKFLQHETEIPEACSDYLWSFGPHPWEADAMTRVVVNTGRRILGKHIHIQAWRQVTVGIARRKFTQAEANLLIEAARDYEETDPALGSMTDALHWQAGHTPHTGNRVYGGTVNFRGGLTDAGLQPFRHVSQIWHQFVRNPLHGPPALSNPRQSAAQLTPCAPNESDRHAWGNPRHSGSRTTGCESPRAQDKAAYRMAGSKRHCDEVEESPIVRRVARRGAPSRSRRRWSMDQAMEVLRRMYGTDARYRTGMQQRAMEHTLAGVGQALAILRTSEGKGLLYLLPSQLPGAGGWNDGLDPTVRGAQDRDAAPMCGSWCQGTRLDS